MANAIPLLEGTDASGGFLVPDVWSDVLVDAILRQSAAWQLSRVRTTSAKREKYPIYQGRPTAAFVAEGAQKAATGAQYNVLQVDVKKIATIVIFTEELLEDAVHDPRILVEADVHAAFADLIDAHVLGLAAGTAITTSFNAGLGSCTQTTELGTAADAFATSVSAAMATVEANGYQANGICAAWDLKQHLRDQRGAQSNATVPVYTPGYEREPDTLYGLPLAYSTNLDAFPAGAGKVAAVVGDFQQGIGVMRRDINVRTSDQATVTVSGTPQNLWQENKVATQWEMRVGYNAHDLNRAFCLITNAV